MCENALLRNVNYIDFLNKLKTINSQTVLHILYNNLNIEEKYKQLKVLYSLISLLEENVLVINQLQQFITCENVQEYTNLIKEIKKEI